MQGELIDEEPSRISTNEFVNMSDIKVNKNSIELTNHKVSNKKIENQP